MADVTNYAHDAQDATRDLVLPPELYERLVTLINSRATPEQLEEGNEETPPLNVIDGFLQTLRSKKTALNDDVQFEGYLNSLSANIGTLTAAQYNTDGNRTRINGVIEAEMYPPKGFEQITTGLNATQVSTLYSIMAELQEYSDAKGIQSVIEGALTNVKTIPFHLMWQEEGIEEEFQNRIKDSFLSRLRLMTDFVKRVGEQQLDGTPIKQHYLIRSTGSDPHQGGQHALFLNPKPGANVRPLVYKEHSLKLEQAFMGRGDSMVTYANGLMRGTDRRLPTMQIDSDAHTEERVSRLGSIEQPLPNTAAANPLFQQLGMLEAVAAISGITDLHGENAMFTNQQVEGQPAVGGPIVIDGECGGDFGGTMINMSTTGVASTDERVLMTVSSLYREPSVDDVQQDYPIQILRQANNEHFHQGRKRMEAHLIRNKDSALDTLRGRMQNVDSFRVVPIQTSGLATDLIDYLGGSKVLRNVAPVDGVAPVAPVAGDIVTTRLNECTTKLNSDKWFYHPAPVVLFEDAFKVAFEQAIQMGTLPSFSLMLAGINAGCIQLDGAVVGEIQYEAEHVRGGQRLTAEELQNRYRNKAGTKIDSYRTDRTVELETAIGTLPNIQGLATDTRNNAKTALATVIMNVLVTNDDEGADALRATVHTAVLGEVSAHFSYTFFEEYGRRRRADEIMNLPFVDELIRQFA